MRWVIAGCLVMLLAVLAGCGGGGATPMTAGVGHAVFTIKWPAAGAINPPQSLAIEIWQAGTTLARRLANAPAQDIISQLSFDNLPVGDLAFSVQTYAGADGTGAVLNNATGGLHISQDAATNLTITLTPTAIDRLEIAPAAPVIEVGKMVQLTATPKDAGGEMVLISPSSFEWTTDNAVAALVDETGLVTGTAAGTAQITVRERVSGKSATARVTVKDPPPPPPDTGTGGAIFTIKWPARRRVVSSVPESLVIEIMKADTVAARQTANYPAGGATSQVTFANLPGGDLVYTASAYGGPDGAGTLVGEVRDHLSVTAGATARVTITLTTTIDRVEIAPTRVVVDMKKSVQLTGTAKTTAGEVVLLEPADLQWSSNNPAIAGVDATGLVTGVHYGTARVTVSERTTGKSAVAVVTVRYSETPSPWDSTRQQGMAHLEQVTTDWQIDPNSARQELDTAAGYFNQVLQNAPDDVGAKWGMAMARSLTGRYDLVDALPSWISIPTLTLVTPIGSSRAMPAAPPARHTRALHARISSLQTRIATQTLPALTQALPFFDDVASAVHYGADIRLRMALDGGVRTVIFSVADVQLLNAHAQAVACLLNFAIAFNLETPGGSPVVANPADLNVNGTLEAAEYLVPAPFLDQTTYHDQAMSDFLSYLKETGIRAQSGAQVDEHTQGPNALIDVNDSHVRSALNSLARLAAGLAIAADHPVTTGEFFSDGASRRINLPKIADITSLRPLLPSFPVNAPTLPGAWPDPTFQGLITPGVPNNFWMMTYEEMANSFQ